MPQDYDTSWGYLDGGQSMEVRETEDAEGREPLDNTDTQNDYAV